MYPNYMNKPFMSNTPNTSFGASTSSFGQPAANTSMFSSVPSSNIFQTPNTSSFNAGPTTQSSFAAKPSPSKRAKKDVSETKIVSDESPEIEPVMAKLAKRLKISDEPPTLDLSLLKFTGDRSNSGSAVPVPGLTKTSKDPPRAFIWASVRFCASKEDPEPVPGPSCSPDPVPKDKDSVSDTGKCRGKAREPVAGPSWAPDPVPGPSCAPDRDPASSSDQASNPVDAKSISGASASNAPKSMPCPREAAEPIPGPSWDTDPKPLCSIWTARIPLAPVSDSDSDSDTSDAPKPVPVRMWVRASVPDRCCTPDHILGHVPSEEPSEPIAGSSCTPEVVPEHAPNSDNGTKSIPGAAEDIEISEPSSDPSGAHEPSSDPNWAHEPSSDPSGAHEPSSDPSGVPESSSDPSWIQERIPSPNARGAANLRPHAGGDSIPAPSRDLSGRRTQRELALGRGPVIKNEIAARRAKRKQRSSLTRSVGPMNVNLTSPITGSSRSAAARKQSNIRRSNYNGPAETHQPPRPSQLVVPFVQQMNPYPPHSSPGHLGIRISTANMMDLQEEPQYGMVPSNRMSVTEFQVAPFPAFRPLGTNLFGQQPQPSTSSLFSGSNAFGQNKPSFGFGSSQPQTGLFGQQPQQQSGTSLFQSNSTNLFGSSTFGNQTTGTVIKFTPVTGQDTMAKNGVTQSISTKHHCITCMKEYEGKSLEELRFEDYSCNRKGPQQQPGFGSAPFGAATSGASTSLFAQPDNKQTFGQPQTFGQTPAFGQPTPAFGVSNQSTAPSLFGKTNTFGATTSTTSTFGFNTPSSSANPFSATPTQKPFSQQPLFGAQQPQTQSTFGTPVFGAANTQNTATNLFQKPPQMTTGFNTGQQGFSFNQPNTTQASNLFQVSKPTTGFGIFSQTSTAPTFGTNVQFANRTQPTFSRPTQPTFGVDTTGMQQSSLFNTKPPSLFTNTTSGGGLFNNNVFGQQQPTSFSLNVNPQQVAQFPPESSDESKNISLVATDSFPDGPHVYGLEPLFGENSNNTTNPKDLKLLLDYSKKRDEMLGTQAKIKVHLPKPKRGNNFNKEFFEANQSLKGSHKCLVIRKFNDNTNSSTIYNKYKNELLEEAADCMKPTDEVEEPSFTEALKVRPTASPVNFDDDSSVNENDIEPLSTSGCEVQLNGGGDLEVDNPAGVILTKPEYYMYPNPKDLHKYIDDNGECIVQGLTIGRRGYGNVYFPDPIDISNMNLDEIVHFRHREVIIYPDDTKKPPIDEGLNRRAQVTLDKIYPREKGTNNYITEVSQIMQTNFVDNLMHVTQKHNCKFVEYRPKTGSWVFKAKHFSKYAFTDSDEEECEINGGTAAVAKPPPEVVLKKIDEVEEVSFGLGGTPQLVKSRPVRKENKESIVLEHPVIEYYPEEDFIMEEEVYQADSAIQALKSSLFVNLEAIQEQKETERMIIERQSIIPCEVLAAPKVYKLPDISLLVVPEKVTTTQRCYSELGVFRANTYKVGWTQGFNFFTTDPIADSEVVYSINRCNIRADGSSHYNFMMPDLTKLLTVTLEESEFSFDKDKVPTLHIRKDVSYLEKQTTLFNDHVKSQSLSGRDKYLCSVWNLCFALWGPGDNSPFSRRQNVSHWLKRFAYDLSDEWSLTEQTMFDRSDVFRTIFKLLSFHKIQEACEFASNNKLDRLSLLISQMSGNERFKYWMQRYVETFEWRERNVVVENFKKLYLLLAGIPVHEDINPCEDLDWMRSFGLHLWYIAPSASPVHVALSLYRKAFEEKEYATKPRPPYCDSESSTEEYDVLYHILALYVDTTYQLCKVLHPETHTDNIMDYRLSWFLLQLFQSLEVGRLRYSEKEHIHTTFSSQLENMEQWKWSIFPLLFLENNIIKKNLIIQILDRNLSTFAETAQIENELVQTFKIPPSWIHEVKAIKAKASGHHYDCFQHYIHMNDYQKANGIFVDTILPELFVNEQHDYLLSFIRRLEPFSKVLVNWQTQVGLVKEFLQLQDALSGHREEGMTTIGGKLSSLLRRINCFPVQNDQQKLCVAELSRKCAFLFKIVHKNMDSQEFQSKFVDVLNNLVMPPDMKHYEIFYLIAKFVQSE